MRTLAILVGAFAGLAAAGASLAQEDNPTTPGAIPNPGSYQGSMTLQHQQDQQDQSFRQQQYQQQQQYPQSRYNAPSGGGYSPRGPAGPPPPRSDAREFGKASPQNQTAEKLNQRGDYAGAVRIWRALAAQGDVTAQYNMGVMYDEGHGVPKNAVQAATYYRMAARKGMGPAMLNLATILMGHAKGPADLVTPYTWTAIAAMRDPDPGVRNNARHNMGVMAQAMSQAQIGQAMAQARAWSPQ